MTNTPHYVKLFKSWHVVGLFEWGPLVVYVLNYNIYFFKKKKINSSIINYENFLIEGFGN
jgi:hypothetical protein